MTGRIQACLDGELSNRESEEIRAHCRECPECGIAWAEKESLCRLLEVETASEPLRPIWPDVQRRLAPTPAGFPRLSIALGTSAAVFVGLLLGLNVSQNGDFSDVAWQQDTLVEAGTLLTGGTGTTLDEIYLSGGMMEGGESQ